MKDFDYLTDYKYYNNNYSYAVADKPFRYVDVSKNLSRSAQPRVDQFEWLKKQGVTDVVNLRKPKIEFINFDEKAVVENLGMKYHNIPTYTRFPKEKQIRQFLKIVNQVEKSNGKVHIHCREGVDRTGLYSFIYKSIKNIGSVGNNLKEWIEIGFHFDSYKELVPWAVNFVNKTKGKSVYFK